MLTSILSSTQRRHFLPLPASHDAKRKAFTLFLCWQNVHKVMCVRAVQKTPSESVVRLLAPQSYCLAERDLSGDELQPKKTWMITRCSAFNLTSPHPFTCLVSANDGKGSSALYRACYGPPLHSWPLPIKLYGLCANASYPFYYLSLPNLTA